MTRTAAKWGILLSLALTLWTIVIHVLGFYTTNIAAGKTADVVVMILPILFITLAVLEQRRAGAGYGRLVGTGVLTGVFSLPVFMTFMWIYHHSINPQWVDHLAAYEQSRVGAGGATQAHADSAIAAIRVTGTDTAQISGSIVGTLILSVVLSLIIAAIVVALRRQSPPVSGPDASVT